MLGEIGQQVIGKSPLVIDAGPLAKLGGDSLNPLGRELVEGRLDSRSLIGQRRYRLPDAPLHIGEDAAELLFRFLSRPALVVGAEGDIATLPVSRKPDRPGAALFRFYDAADGFPGHQRDPRLRRSACT